MSTIDCDDRLSIEALKAYARQWKVGLISGALTFAVLAMTVFALTPMYRSHVQILLPASGIEDPSDRKGVTTAQADAAILRSYDEMAEDDGLALTVMRRLDLEANDEFNRPPNLFQRAIESIKTRLFGSDGVSMFSRAELKRDAVLHDYEGRLKVKNETKSLVLGFSFDASDPFLAQRILEAHANAFVEAQVDRRRQEAEIKVRWMKLELDKAADEVRAEQTAMQLRSLTSATTKSSAADSTADLHFRQVMINSRQNVYEVMLARYQNMVAEQRYIGSDVAILSPASLPTRPAFPKKGLMLPAAAALACFIAMFVMYVWGKCRRQVTAEELCADADLPILGRMNFPGRPRLGRFAYARRLRTAFFWEQIAEIRSCFCLPAHVQLPSPAARRRRRMSGTVIAITSASTGEGKSLLAASFARTIAGGGSRTLILDLDTRPKNLRLASPPSLGLQDALNAAPLGETAVPIDSVVPLFLLARRDDVAFDVSALTGAKLKALLEKARRDFDVIVIDTAGLDVISDTLSLTRLVDEVIVVALHGQEAPSGFTVAIDKLRSRGTKLAGVVVTDHTRPAPGRFAKLKPYIVGQQPSAIWSQSQRRRATWTEAFPKQLMPRRPALILSKP